ncbi:hypothetical protein Tco_0289964 [Tanacetum coccineum]
MAERLVWLEIKGVPFRAWTNDTFNSICKKWGEVLFIDDTDSSNRFSIRLCIKSTHTSLIFASTLVTLKGVTYAYRVRELCSWIPTFATEDVDSDEEGFVDKSNNPASDNDEEDEEESVGESVGHDDYVPHLNKDESLAAKDTVQPSNSDPFELESLIAKNGNYQTSKLDSETPKFPPGFTQSDNGDNKNEFSDACKPMERETKADTPTSSQHSQVKNDEVTKKYVGVSLIQQVEDTIKVGITLGFNMEGCQEMLEKMIADMGNKDLYK